MAKSAKQPNSIRRTRLRIPHIDDSVRENLTSILANIEDHYYQITLSEVGEKDYLAQMTAWMTSLKNAVISLGYVALDELIDEVFARAIRNYKKNRREIPKVSRAFLRGQAMEEASDLVFGIITERVWYYEYAPTERNDGVRGRLRETTAGR
jgi:hypothetical protein